VLLLATNCLGGLALGSVADASVVLLRTELWQELLRESHFYSASIVYCFRVLVRFRCQFP